MFVYTRQRCVESTPTAFYANDRRPSISGARENVI